MEYKSRPYLDLISSFSHLFQGLFPHKKHESPIFKEKETKPKNKEKERTKEKEIY